MTFNITRPFQEILFLVLICISFNLSAQDQARVDSLLSLLPAKDDTTNALIYKDLKNEYQFKNEAKSKEYLNKYIEYCRKSGIDRFIIQSYYSEGVYYNNLGNLPKAEEKFNKVRTLLNPETDGTRLANLYYALANLASGQGDHQLGIENVQKSIDLIVKLDMDPILLARNYRVLGNIHALIENWNLSDQYYRKAIKIFIELDEFGEAMTDSMGIGMNYIQQSEYEKSRPIMEAAVQFFEKSGDLDHQIYAYSNIGNIEQQTKNFDKAEISYQKGLKLAEENGILSDFVTMSTRLADIYNDTGRDKESIELLEEVEEINGIYGGADMQVVIYDQLRQSYINLNKHEEAYSYLSKFGKLNDSLMSVEKISAINELEVKYQTEKKEQEIKLLEEKAKRSSLEKKGMIGGVIGLLGLFGALFFAMRQRMTKNQLAKEKVEQELVFNIKELDHKKQELTAYALQIAHKNEVLEGIKSNVNEIKVGNESNRDLQKIVNTIDINQNSDESWDGFRSRFLAVHKDFEVDVKNKYPKVTVNELRLMALLKMQLTSKEIANILNISSEGIKKARYRLRKKLQLEPSDSLEDLVLAI